MKESEIIEALKAGHLVFTARGGKAVIEKDQNTLTSFSPEKGKAFSKNRVIRVLDMLAEDVQRIFEDYYLGKAIQQCRRQKTLSGRAAGLSETAFRDLCH